MTWFSWKLTFGKTIKKHQCLHCFDFWVSRGFMTLNLWFLGIGGLKRPPKFHCLLPWHFYAFKCLLECISRLENTDSATAWQFVGILSGLGHTTTDNLFESALLKPHIVIFLLYFLHMRFFKLWSRVKTWNYHTSMSQANTLISTEQKNEADFSPIGRISTKGAGRFRLNTFSFL